MTSTEIVNAALTRIGCEPITALGDLATAEGRCAFANYTASRDFVLEDREWTFAKWRVALALDPVAPAFGYTYQYIIPSDVVRVVRVYPNGSTTFTPADQLDDYVREGPRILANEVGPLYAEVLRRVDEATFSPGMVQALVAHLMSVMAGPLAENAKLGKDSLDAYAALVSSASAMDGSQGRSQKFTQPALPGRRR